MGRCMTGLRDPKGHISGSPHLADGRRRRLAGRYRLGRAGLQRRAVPFVAGLVPYALHRAAGGRQVGVGGWRARRPGRRQRVRGLGAPCSTNVCSPTQLHADPCSLLWWVLRALKPLIRRRLGAPSLLAQPGPGPLAARQMPPGCLFVAMVQYVGQLETGIMTDSKCTRGEVPPSASSPAGPSAPAIQLQQQSAVLWGTGACCITCRVTSGWRRFRASTGETSLWPWWASPAGRQWPGSSAGRGEQKPTPAERKACSPWCAAAAATAALSVAAASTRHPQRWHGGNRGHLMLPADLLRVVVSSCALAAGGSAVVPVASRAGPGVRSQLHPPARVVGAYAPGSAALDRAALRTAATGASAPGECGSSTHLDPGTLVFSIHGVRRALQSMARLCALWPPAPCRSMYAPLLAWRTRRRPLAGHRACFSCSWRLSASPGSIW